MALPSKYSVSMPIEVVASGGLLVRQVDTNGVALDDSTYVYSVALPVMPVDTNGQNEDATRIVSVHTKVTIHPNGMPIIRIDASGNATNTSLSGGAGSAGQPLGLLLTLTKAA